MIVRFPLLTPRPPSRPKDGWGHVYRPYRHGTVKGQTELLVFHLWYRDRRRQRWENRGMFPWFDQREEAEQFLRDNRYTGVVKRYDLEPEAWDEKGEHPHLGGPWFPWKNVTLLCEVRKIP